MHASQETRSTAHRRSVRRGFGRAMAIGLCFAAPAALALPSGSGSSCYSEGFARAQGVGPNEQFWIGGCTGQAEARGEVDVIVDAETTYVHTFQQAARAVGNGSAGLGSLHAFALTRASSDPMRYIYIDSGGGTGVTPNNYVARAESRLHTEWHDQFQVEWPYFSTAPVAVRITVALSGSTSSPPDPAYAGIAADLYMQNDRGYSDHYASLGAPGVQVIETTFRPYWTYQLQGTLSAYAWVQAGHECNVFTCPPLPEGYIAFAEATANASNTAGFYIEVLSPGAKLTSLSGATYTAPVPEPASAWLFGVGILGVLAAMQRHRASGGTTDFPSV